MKILIFVFLFVKLFGCSVQTCTKFKQTVPSTFDLNKIQRSVVLNIENVPKLFNYDNGDAIDRDLASYYRGTKEPQTIEKMVQSHGYELEKHGVRTHDGYHLTLHRIPGKGRNVFLNHGILGSSIDWVMAGKQSLPYLLADQGYDVWLGNARGNQYSRRHESMSPDCAEFWDFSWEEIGIYDLPASIEYILDVTENEDDKITYIGYSQGTTAFFVLCSMLPYYNNRISSMIALSPIAWVSHMKSPILRVLAAEHNVESPVLKAIGVNQVAPNDQLTRTLAAVLCADNKVSQILCSSLSSLICGLDKGQLNMTNLYTIYQHFPAGSSTKQLNHYAQGFLSDQFRRFDYDMSKNVYYYGSIVAPDYPVEKVNVSVSLFYSDSDWVSDNKDVAILKEKLPKVVESVFVKDYNHLDYLWANNVKEKVYDKVLELIKKYKAKV